MRVSVEEVQGRLDMEQAPLGSGHAAKPFGAQQALRQCSQMFNTLPCVDSMSLMGPLPLRIFFASVNRPLLLWASYANKVT